MAQSWNDLDRHVKCLSYMYSSYVIHLSLLSYLIAQKHQITFFPNTLHFLTHFLVCFKSGS